MKGNDYSKVTTCRESDNRHFALIMSPFHETNALSMWVPDWVNGSGFFFNQYKSKSFFYIPNLLIFCLTEYIKIFCSN